MSIPPFSIFSAISELFVTAGVWFVIRRNWTRRPFPGLLFLMVALFEAFVNVLYMAYRTSVAATGGRDARADDEAVLCQPRHPVAAYVAFVILGVFAFQDQKRNRWFFAEHPRLTWTFVVVWAVSILSGETIFVMRYLWRG